MDQSTGTFDIRQSTFYQQCELERGALMEHKWYLSEQAGRDVGMEYATWDWVMRGHRARWVAQRRATGTT